MRIRLAGLALGALGTIAWGCVGTPDPYNVLSFCTDAAQATCQVASVCGIDSAVCQTYQYGQCKTKAVQTTSPERRVYNSDNAHVCVTALQWAYGNGATTVGSSQLASIHDSCERVYVGMSGVGDFCEMDYDCAGGMACVPKTPGTNPTMCEPAQSVVQGESCDNPGALCASGTYCAKQGSSWSCSPAPAVGQPCAMGEYCANADHCEQNVCVARGGNGAPCVNNGDCAADSPFCDPYSNTCASGLSFQRGNVDCRGLAGLTPPPPDPPDAGGGGSEGGAP
jgi:hypothetical protein